MNAIWLDSASWRTVSHVIKEPCHTSVLQGEAWVDELLNGNKRRFRNQLRMQPESFQALLDMLVSNGSLKSSRYVTAKEKLATFLFVVGHAASNRLAQERFQRSGWTITQSFNEVFTHTIHIVNFILCSQYCLTLLYGTMQVLESIMVIYPTVVVSPNSSCDIPYEIHSNPKMFPFFEQCIGALDGTHISAIPPKGGEKPFRNRKGFKSQNVLAACSFDLRFVYVLAGWEGSASDGRVLNDALHCKGFSIPDGRMYLGNYCI
jgi:hypothetical protein